MADPIKWKSKIVLAKMEGATYGVDPVPVGATDAMLMTDITFQPMEGEDVSRNLELAFLGAQEEIPTGLRAVLTGSVELAGSGTAGTAPAYGPLLRACGCAEVVTANTMVEYSPISDNQESVALYFFLGPTRFVMLGVRGTFVETLNAQGIPVLRFTLTGLFTQPSDQARPVIDQSKFQGPQVASKANTPVFTIGGQAFVARSFEFTLGNDVQPRMLIGAERIIIVDRAESLALTVEAVSLATYNPFLTAEQRTRRAIVLQHGVAAGRKVALSIPTAQQKRPTGFSNAQGVLEWPLNFTPLASSAGNDQWKLTVS